MLYSVSTVLSFCVPRFDLAPAVEKEIWSWPLAANSAAFSFWRHSTCSYTNRRPALLLMLRWSPVSSCRLLLLEAFALLPILLVIRWPEFGNAPHFRTCSDVSMCGGVLAVPDKHGRVESRFRSLFNQSLGTKTVFRSQKNLRVRDCSKNCGPKVRMAREIEEYRRG